MSPTLSHCKASGWCGNATGPTPSVRPAVGPSGVRPSVTNDEYCREIEAYLCRKNDGHLIRIVGPSFERVCSWASQGVPFKIACQGIDRYFDRYYAKPGRRR